LLYVGSVAGVAFVQAGRVADAQAIIERALGAGADPSHPMMRRMRSIVAIAAGRPREALADLRAAADELRRTGASRWEGRIRYELGQALAGLGEVEAAQSELREVLRSAEDREAALVARLAREALARLGERSITTEHVKQALEALHQPHDLVRAPLGKLLGAAGASDLERILRQTVEHLAASPEGRDREAGRLLSDYYVKRVGSQEVVADRLHLTRATFYRRLHLGWGLVAKRLAQAEGPPAPSPTPPDALARA
ncbi:MAG: hypothetical protein M3024_15735, partial [Candidatus Dormibacteraeota bacterium]|nr:hypothetical protein [Candidatus Dormibacteraeota bacterium]